MHQHRKIAEVRLTYARANLVGIAATLCLLVGGVMLSRLMPGHRGDSGRGPGAVLLGFLLIIVLHEGLHGIGMRVFAGVPWQRIRFGIIWKALTPYCHCELPVPLRAYRRMALLPLGGTGLLTVLLLLLHPRDWTGALLGLTLAGCVGDVWIVALLRRFSGDLLVLDSPSEIGCDVFEGRG